LGLHLLVDGSSDRFGFVSATIHAMSDTAFRALIGHFTDFYADSLMNPHWGKIVNIRGGRRLEINMAFQGLDDAQMEAIWRPILGPSRSRGVGV
jgi:hypothetical protein